MDSFSDSDGNEEQNIVKKICNWCGECKMLVANKPYCLDCKLACKKECKRCHRPFPDLKYFSLSNIRCNTCEKKRIAEKEKREERKKSQQHDDHKTDTLPSKADSCLNPSVTSSVILQNRRIGYIPIYM